MKNNIYFIVFVSLFCSQIYAQKESVLVDFGYLSTASANPWNNITDNSSGFTSNLINSDNVKTGIGIQVIDGFNGIGSSGTQSPSVSEIPLISGDSSGDFFFGTASDSGVLEFSNLIRNKDYTFTIFASRDNVSDIRETNYLIEGITSETLVLDAGGNSANAVSFTVKPKNNGTVKITVFTGSNNNSQYNYLNCLAISYDTDVVTPSDNALLIDFGANTNTSASPWNNITDPIAGSISSLVSYSGASSGVSLAITDRFNYANEEGTDSPGLTINVPGTATADSFFGNTPEYEGKIEPSGAMQFGGFSSGEEVSFTMYASRLDYAEYDNKQTKYIVEGLTTETVYLDAANNINKSVSASVKAKVDGTIDILISAGEDNTSPYQFFYIGAIKVDYNPVPSISVSSPNGGEFWQAGKNPVISWESNNLSDNITLEYSTDNGSSWTAIATVSDVTESYTWEVPSEVSTDCLVRLTSGALNDVSDSVFEISDDISTCTVVVIGSSTAEGLGASSIENSWVYKYNNILFQNDTRLNVVNLGLGGLTTYNLLPTGSSTALPSGVSIDTNRNITKALSYGPVAIIVNLPSNDTYNGYSRTTQLANFAEINTEAANSSIPIWITTTQPRYFSDPADVQTQKDVRDDILSTYLDKCIDFWTDIADTDGTILSYLDSGDGTHVNDDGHSILLNKVISKNIGDLTCSSSTLSDDVFAVDSLSVKLYPNPLIDGDLNFSFASLNSGTLQLELYNTLGQKITAGKEFYNFNTGSNTFKINMDHIKSQVLYCIFNFKYKGEAAVTKSYTLYVE
ncbi:SGNH/GDSL hydrolase family protein [Algibacter sp. Ld11]|uniref:SGNH/GDSL hydrolase family protein n=1 Tax=Algibacter sp. Ld11 TaxID=649150 RepID=UPI00386C1FCA